MKNQIDLLSNQKKVHDLFSILSLLVGFSVFTDTGTNCRRKLY